MTHNGHGRGPWSTHIPVNTQQLSTTTYIQQASTHQSDQPRPKPRGCARGLRVWPTSLLKAAGAIVCSVIVGDEVRLEQCGDQLIDPRGQVLKCLSVARGNIIPFFRINTNVVQAARRLRPALLSSATIWAARISRIGTIC